MRGEFDFKGQSVVVRFPPSLASTKRSGVGRNAARNAWLSAWLSAWLHCCRAKRVDRDEARLVCDVDLNSTSGSVAGVNFCRKEIDLAAQMNLDETRRRVSKSMVLSGTIPLPISEDDGRNR